MRIRSDGRKFRTETEIRELVLKYESSGLTQSRFCEQEGIAESNLYRWLNEHRVGVAVSGSESQTIGSFIEVKGSKHEVNNGIHYQIELELPQGIVLRLS